MDIVVDNAGNTFVTGYATNTGSALDIVTIKYNSSGVQQWLTTYNGIANSSDYGRSITLDNAGNVYVGGFTYGSGSNFDLVSHVTQR